jgi:hypothetical protein
LGDTPEMIARPIHEISLDDLNALVGIVRESKTIEFKREMPARKADDVIKFLAAVSSLANTGGGDLLIGIEARAGLATAISGVAFPDLDAEKLRLSQLLATNLEPRLPRVDIEAIETSGNRHVLVIRVQQSWLAPHRVKVNDKFYGRNSAGKYPLDVSELRTAFVLSDSVAERIRNFRNDRLIKIAGGESSVSLYDRPAMIIHVVPFSTFAAGRTVDVVQTAMQPGRPPILPQPPGSRHGSPIALTNLDGFAIISTTEAPPEQRAGAYAQLFRSAAIEGVYLLEQDRTDKTRFYIFAQGFENIVVAAVKNYISFLMTLDVGLPIFIFLSFCGMSRCYLRETAAMGVGWNDYGPLKVDAIALPEVTIESDPANVPGALRQLFNTIWNGFGFQGSPKYNATGEWIGTA